MKRFLTWIKSVLGVRSAPNTKMYELVECQLEGGMFREGIRLLHGKYLGIVVTVSPKVEFKELPDGTPQLTFDFTIEYVPSTLGEITKTELHPIVGNCIVDIITKELNEN